MARARAMLGRVSERGLPASLRLAVRALGWYAWSILRPPLGRLQHHAPRPLRSPRPPSNEMPAGAALSVSIVTPSFNQAEYLERTLRSVLDQGYSALEYRVHDGASSDDSLAILERYTEALAAVVSEPDDGQADAINRGFAQTQGEIMAWLNSDDLLLPGALQRVSAYFAAHPDVDVIYGNRILIDEEDREIGRWVLPDHDDEVLSWADFVPQETLFWRRRIWDRVGGELDTSYRFALDWDLLVRFRDAGARFAHVDAFLGAFRIHAAQKTSSVILDLGRQEMDRIRMRCLGRVPSDGEIRRAVLPYLLRHLVRHHSQWLRGRR